MHDEGVTYFLSIPFKSILLGGEGGRVQGVSLQYCRRKYSFCYLPMIIEFLTLDEMEFGVSDLGM